MFTKKKTTGIGTIIRDSRGQTIAAMSKRGPGIMNATTAEAMAASKCTVQGTINLHRSWDVERFTRAGRFQNHYRFTI